MYLKDLFNAYEYARERRKDEMRAAAQSNLLRELRGSRKSSHRLVAALSGLALVLAVLSLLLMGCNLQAAQMEPKTNNVPEAASYQAVLGAGRRTEAAAPYLTSVPAPGARIESAEIQGNRILMRLTGNGEELVILDAATGRLLGRIRLEAGP